MKTKEKSSNYLENTTTSFVELMDELLDIRGYKAAAIMTCDGELLYSNAAGQVKDQNMHVFIGALDNLFGQACSLTEKTGFLSCTEVTLKTGREVAVIRCSGKDCLVGIRLFVVIEEGGNVVLMQRQLGNLLPRIMRCLTWEPDNLVPLFMRESAWRQMSEILAKDN